MVPFLNSTPLTVLNFKVISSSEFLRVAVIFAVPLPFLSLSSISTGSAARDTLPGIGFSLMIAVVGGRVVGGSSVVGTRVVGGGSVVGTRVVGISVVAVVATVVV